jgi:hypothetical protein
MLVEEIPLCIVFYCAFIVCLIIKPRYVLYVGPLECVHHITFLVLCKTSMIFSMGAMECLLSAMCKFWLPISIFKVSEMFLKSYIKSTSVCPMYLLLQS